MPRSRVGLYSVVSYTVLQRTSELGVRVALGARRRDLLSIVALSAGSGVGLGIAAGLALSFGLNRVIGCANAKGGRKDRGKGETGVTENLPERKTEIL